MAIRRVGVVLSQQHLCPCGDTRCKHKKTPCCNEFKQWCRCPFPTKTFAYGKAQYELDLEGLDRLHENGTYMYTKYLEKDSAFSWFDFQQLSRWERRIDGMRQRCKGRLLNAAMRAQDAKEEH